MKKLFILMLVFFIGTLLIGCDAQSSLLDDIISDNNNQSDVISGLEEDVADLESQIADLITENESQNDSIDALEQSVLEHTTAISDLEVALEVSNTAISDLETALEVSNTAISDLQTALALSDYAIDELTAKLAVSNSAISALENALISANTTISELTDDLALLSTQLQTLETNLVTSDSNITSLSDDLSALDLIVSDISTQLNATISNLATVQADLGIASTNISDLDESLQITNDDIDQLNSNLQEEIDGLNSQYIALSEVVAQLRFLSNNPLSFEQDGETLSGQLTYDEPLAIYGEDFEYVGADILVSHPLTAEAGVSDLVSTYSLDNSTLLLDFDVPYHGLFNIEVIFNYSDGTENLSYSYLIESPFKASQYNLVWLNATMPVLLFATDMMTGKYDQGYTYVEIERARTFDFTKLPSNALGWPNYASASHGNYDQSSVPNFYNPVCPLLTDDTYALDWMNELYELDNASNFTFVTVDNNFYALTGVFMTGIPLDNLDFKVYTDGGYSSLLMNTNFSDMASYTSVYNDYIFWRDATLNGTNLTDYWVNRFILPATEFDNFEYIVNNITSWNFDSALMDQVLLNNVTVLPVDVAFQNVIDANKLVEFEYLLKTRWGDLPEESMASYFNNSPKNNLLILGTSPTAESSSAYATFEKYVEYIVANYGNEYDIFYKGHPRYPSDETRQNFLTTNNITELEASIPVETLMLLYSNVFVGGYTSTSFQSSLEGQTIFFFGSVTVIDNNATLALMISEGIIFANTVYLIPDGSGEVVIE